MVLLESQSLRTTVVGKLSSVKASYGEQNTTHRTVLVVMLGQIKAQLPEMCCAEQCNPDAHSMLQKHPHTPYWTSNSYAWHSRKCTCFLMCIGISLLYFDCFPANSFPNIQYPWNESGDVFSQRCFKGRDPGNWVFLWKLRVDKEDGLGNPNKWVSIIIKTATYRTLSAWQ